MLDEERLIQILIKVLWSTIKRVNDGFIKITISLDDSCLNFCIEDTGNLVSVSLANILKEEIKDIIPEKNPENIRLVMSNIILKELGGTICTKHDICTQESLIRFPITPLSREEFACEDSKEFAEEVKAEVVPTIDFNLNPLSSWKKGNKRLPNRENESVAGMKTKCLVVDDVQMNRFILRSMAERQGFEVTEARNGIEAVRLAYNLANQGNRALIFMDFDMPEMNGVEATRRIRELKEVVQPIVIAVTAYSGEEERNLCEKAGMNDFIAKPITQHAIRKIIENFGID